MTIQVTGVLVDPTGSAIASAEIRITALETHEALASSCAVKTTGLDGSYNFNLLNGKFKIHICQKNNFEKIAYVAVTGVTTTPITIEDLINTYAFCEVEAPTCPV